MSVIEIKNVSFSYDKNVKALDGVTFSVEEGDYVAVIGHNGSGKSTLAKLINGLLKPDDGDITVDGFSVCDKKNIFEVRKRVGVVFQNPDNQIVASVVEDDVAFGPENLGVKREEIGERIDFALSAVGMEQFRNASPMRLSGGQKQRVAIAGVLALMPKILVLDESTSMLDPVGRKEVLSVVRKLNKENKITVIAITHYMDEIVDADKVFVLNGGTLAAQGTPEKIFADREKLKGFGLEIPLSAFIAEKLAEKGVINGKGILTQEQLAEALCEL